jgi:hypothetical protein
VTPEEAKAIDDLAAGVTGPTVPVEAAKHHMDVDSPLISWNEFGGAQDFGEYDQWKDTVQREARIDSLSAVFNGLLDNIRNDAELTMDVKASRIATVAGELGRRVQAENSSHLEEDEKALNDPATGTFWFEAGDFSYAYAHDQEAAAEKAATGRGRGVELRASDFAIVPDATLPETWKLPLVRERSGGFDLPRIGDAITALQPSGTVGQPADPRSPQARALSRISAAITKAAGDTKAKAALRDRLTKVQQRTDGGSFTAFKDLRGDWRWFTIHSNGYVDRDGERFAAKAHDEYVEWVDADPAARMPELRVWHIPGSRLGRADFIDHADGFMIASGPFDADMEHAAKALAESDDDLGCSHGFWFDPDAFQQGVYHRYRSFEVSVLPRDRAANEATGFIAGKEVPEMDADKKAMLVSTVGQERADTVEATLATLSKEVGEGSVAYKDLEAALTAPAATKDDGEDAGATKPGAATAPPTDLEPIATAIAAVADTVKEIVATVAQQGEQIEALKEMDAEKIALAWRPRFDPSKGYVASGSEKSEEDEDSEAVKAVKAHVKDAAAPEHLGGYFNEDGGLAGLGGQPVPAEGAPA